MYWFICGRRAPTSHSAHVEVRGQFSGVTSYHHVSLKDWNQIIALSGNWLSPMDISSASLSFFETKSLTRIWGLPHPLGLRQRDLVPYLSLPTLEQVLQACITNPGCFTWVLETDFWFSGFQRKHFPHWAISSVPWMTILHLIWIAFIHTVCSYSPNAWDFTLSSTENYL